MSGESGHQGLGDFRVPDSTQPLRGYRKWRMTPEGHLAGVNYPQRWTPGVNTAMCNLMQTVRIVPRNLGPVFYAAGLGWHENEDGMLSPATGYERAPCPGIARENHGCGFYARHGGRLQYEAGTDFAVSGVVDCWGQVEFGPHGIRCEHASIVALCQFALRAATERSILRGETKLDEMTEMLHRPEVLGSTDPTTMLELAVQVDIMREHLDELKSGPARWAAVRERFPDVPVFETEAEMLEAFEVPDYTSLARGES